MGNYLDVFEVAYQLILLVVCILKCRRQVVCERIVDITLRLEQIKDCKDQEPIQQQLG
jgi:hypothetical protein